MSFVDNAVQEIDSHLEELHQEAERLESAKALLLGDVPVARKRGPGRPPKNGNGSSQPAKRGPGRPPGRSGNRAEQALKLVTANPGISIPDLAQKMKIQPNYLYRVMPKLEGEGQIKRDEKGWVPA